MTSITVEKFKHEELVNVLTHLPGVFIGITFTVLLLLKNYNAPFSHLLSYIIYSISFVTIYAASTIYHHAIWHILVLCGSTSHFFAVYGTY